MTKPRVSSAPSDPLPGNTKRRERRGARNKCSPKDGRRHVPGPRAPHHRISNPLRANVCSKAHQTAGTVLQAPTLPQQTMSGGGKPPQAPPLQLPGKRHGKDTQPEAPPAAQARNAHCPRPRPGTRTEQRARQGASSQHTGPRPQQATRDTTADRPAPVPPARTADFARCPPPSRRGRRAHDRHAAPPAVPRRCRRMRDARQRARHCGGGGTKKAATQPLGRGRGRRWISSSCEVGTLPPRGRPPLRVRPLGQLHRG